MRASYRVRNGRVRHTRKGPPNASSDPRSSPRNAGARRGLCYDRTVDATNSSAAIVDDRRRVARHGTSRRGGVVLGVRGRDRHGGCGLPSSENVASPRVRGTTATRRTWQKANLAQWIRAVRGRGIASVFGHAAKVVKSWGESSPEPWGNLRPGVKNPFYFNGLVRVGADSGRSRARGGSFQ